jgi:hypothetical protein
MNNNKFSIVIPTLWKSDKIFTMLDFYEKCLFIEEIIIIDNDPDNSPNLEYNKVKKYTKGTNILVNPAWNWGRSLSKHKLILANDDIIINDISKILNLLLNTDYDIVGVDTKNYNENIRIDDIDHRIHGYGVFMYVKNYFYIPEQIKIWYGDDFLFFHNKKRGILRNSGIITTNSETINTNRAFYKEICKNDRYEYEKIISTTNHN